VATDYSETVLDSIVSALQGILVASSYNYDLRGAERWDRDDHTDHDIPYAVVERLNQLSNRAGSELVEELTVGINLTISQDPDSAERTSVIEGKWIYDVKKALAGAFTLTGVEVRLDQISTTPYHVEDEDETDDGLVFVVILTYSTAYENPALLVSPQ
jgi:hypothetical protein